MLRALLLCACFSPVFAADSAPPPPPVSAPLPPDPGVASTPPSEISDSGALTPPSAFAFRGGLGFTADPDTFLTALEFDFVATPNISLGPLIQIGVSDKHTLIAPTLNARYQFLISDADKDVARLKPFVNAGLGLVYMEKERKHRTDADEVDFLLNTGFGLEYDLHESVSVGTHFLFNIVPWEVVDERFFFSWQVLTLTLRF